MKKLVLFSLLALAGCATSADVPTVLSQPVDASVQQQAASAQLAALSTGRLKFKGPVTIQLGGTGNVASATAAPRAKAPVAAGPASTATDASRKAGTPWYVFAGIGLLGFALGGWAAWRLTCPRELP